MTEITDYLAWRKAWLSKHETVGSAVAMAKELAGEEYAAQVAKIIEEMESRLSRLS